MGLARRIIPSVMGKHLCIYCRTNGWHNNLTDVIDTSYYRFGFQTLRGPRRGTHEKRENPENRRNPVKQEASARFHRNSGPWRAPDFLGARQNGTTKQRKGARRAGILASSAIPGSYCGKRGNLDYLEEANYCNTVSDYDNGNRRDSKSSRDLSLIIKLKRDLTKLVNRL